MYSTVKTSFSILNLWEREAEYLDERVRKKNATNYQGQKGTKFHTILDY